MDPIILTRTVIASVGTVVCLIAVVLFSITTIKNHCCGQHRQYSRKQRIFLYLLLASLGCIGTDGLLFIDNRDACIAILFFNMFFGELQLYIFCWAAIYLCRDVFRTLKRGSHRIHNKPGRRFCVEMIALACIAVFSVGYGVLYVELTSPELYCVLKSDHNSSFVGAQWWLFSPLDLAAVIGAVSILVASVRLCFSYCYTQENVNSQDPDTCHISQKPKRPCQIPENLTKSITEIIIFAFFASAYAIVDIIEDGLWAKYRDHPVPYPLVFIFGVSFPIIDSIIPAGFLLSFGRKMLSDLGCRCCCGKHRRRQEYSQVPGSVHVQDGVQSTEAGTNMTYYTCNTSLTSTATTRAFYSCVDSQSPESFPSAAPATDPQQ